MDSQTAEYYERNAVQLAATYEAAASPIERYFALAFASGSRVLDVGAGSGRDLAALVRAGYDGYGIEPCVALREAAAAAHPELAGRLSGGSLPAIDLPFGGGFDGVVCCAVLMHLPSLLKPSKAGHQGVEDPGHFALLDFGKASGNTSNGR